MIVSVYTKDQLKFDLKKHNAQYLEIVLHKSKDFRSLHLLFPTLYSKAKEIGNYGKGNSRSLQSDNEIKEE